MRARRDIGRHRRQIDASEGHRSVRDDCMLQCIGSGGTCYVGNSYARRRQSQRTPDAELTLVPKKKKVVNEPAELDLGR